MNQEQPHRIDVHCHSVLPCYRKALEEAALGANVRLPPWSPELALSTMDRHGIGVMVTSIAVPGTHLGDDAQARDLARRCNDDAAEMTRKYPRLGALATLPLPHVGFACEEAIRALDQLKMDGVGLLTSYAGKHIGRPEYDPLLEILDARSAVVTLHPTVHPSTKMIDIGVPNFMLEYPFETTRAAVTMILGDVLDRFPHIRFILSHGGGTLPFLTWRVSAVATWHLSHPPAAEQFLREKFPTRLTRKYAEFRPEIVKSLVRRFYFDTALAPDASSLGSVTKVADPQRILFGSDWPYVYETFVADEVKLLREDPDLAASERAAIEQENALRLFPRFAGVVSA